MCVCATSSGVVIAAATAADGDVVITDVTSATDADANDISITVGAGGVTGGNAEIGTINAGTAAGDVILTLTSLGGHALKGLGG